MSDVTIIGAGVAGLFAAYELARRGLRPRIIDRSGPPGRHGCSWWAGGMLAPHCEGVTAEPIITRLGAEAAAAWAPITPVIHRGTLVVALDRDRGELTRFARRSTDHQTCAPGDLEPDLSHHRAGLFFPSEAHLDPRRALADPALGYTGFVAPGNQRITDPDAPIAVLPKMPQMPTYHLTRPNGQGITLVNIGVGPSNAKTATDHIAVLRPHAWLMVGHCAGLRNSQSLGDFVLAHAYLREDHVLDDDLPVWVPIPALAEVQVALQEAVAEVTQLEGYELKRIMRTGTVATIDNRNWELRDQSGPVHRLSLSRAVALDMESATIAANGFRFRVPYGTLLCVSDKPLHGELKLPGMATDFYRTQVASHLLIGIRAMEKLRDMPLERIHSRKLRSFSETAFL